MTTAITPIGPFEPIVILPVPGPAPVLPPDEMPAPPTAPALTPPLRNGNPGIVPPWLQIVGDGPVRMDPDTPHIMNDNGGIVPPWLTQLMAEHVPHRN